MRCCQWYDHPSVEEFVNFSAYLSVPSLLSSLCVPVMKKKEKQWMITHYARASFFFNSRSIKNQKKNLEEIDERGKLVSHADISCVFFCFVLVFVFHAFPR